VSLLGKVQNAAASVSNSTFCCKTCTCEHHVDPGHRTTQRRPVAAPVAPHGMLLPCASSFFSVSKHSILNLPNRCDGPTVTRIIAQAHQCSGSPGFVQLGPVDLTAGLCHCITIGGDKRSSARTPLMGLMSC
jgi:hypothetical protein